MAIKIKSIFSIALIFITGSVWAQVQGVDTLIAKSNALYDRLQVPQGKIDSVQTEFLQKSDSLNSICHAQLSALEAARTKLQSKVDSLRARNLPTENVTHKIDSMNQLQQNAIASFNEKLKELKSKTTDRLKELNLPPELQAKVTGAIRSVDNFTIPVADLAIPSSGFSNPLQNFRGLNGLSSPLADGVGVDALQDVQSSLGDVGNIADQVGGYTDDMKQIASGTAEEIRQLPQTIENQAAEISGANELLGETQALDQYTEMLGQAQNPEALKEEAIEQVQQLAFDHFAGKQEVLQQAMDKMEKLKKKYAGLGSLPDDLTKRYNEMKGKPFIERLMPGLALQMMKRSYFMTDFNVYVGYRFTGKLTAGPGWNQRVLFDTEALQFRNEGRIYGPRFYGEYNVWKGFCPRIEIECMNTFVTPRAMPAQTDIGQREWGWSYFVGLKKEYRFIKTVKGTAQVMFNIFNAGHKSPYPDVVNMRFGFEFPMKKKPK